MLAKESPNDTCDKLLVRYPAEEVHEVLFEIWDFKGPGLDGLHIVFYKRFWPM